MKKLLWYIFRSFEGYSDSDLNNSSFLDKILKVCGFTKYSSFDDYNKKSGLTGGVEFSAKCVDKLMTYGVD